jgi:uncharacterized protein with beta-barrel porin domain
MKALCRICGPALLLMTLVPASAVTLSLPPPNPSTGNIDVSASEGVFDLGTRFLRRLANGYAGGGSNPQGGGGPAVATPPRYRSWVEGYGLTARTGAQDTFTGDKRTTWGVIGGVGATLTPELNVGVSVDQGWTKIDVEGFPQSARVDLTQIGANAAYQMGNWTLAGAVIHGFGDVNTSRVQLGAESTAAYAVKMWGVLAELSYLQSVGNGRMVPKLGFDWTQVETDAFRETGGFFPVAGAATKTERTRIFGGAEVGYTWQSGHVMFDLSGYGRIVGVLSQDIGSLQVSFGSLSSPVQGVKENSPQFDTGASATVRLNPQFRLYAVYDGRFRDGYESHGGTLGAEFRW